MNIPTSCNDWVALLAAADSACDACHCSRLIRNIETDPCVPSDVEKLFFDRIESELPAANHEEAIQIGKKAAAGDPPETEDLRFCGQSVPNDRFQQVTRFFNTKALWYVLGEEFVSVRHGLSRSELEELSGPRLKSLLDNAAATNPPMEIKLGKHRDPVFVTEVSETLNRARSNPIDLVARLGLPWLVDHLKEGKNCVQASYTRNDLPGGALNVPRVLDALDFAPFAPTTDPMAPTGLTQPVPPASDDGLPEAIHRPCALPSFELSSLEP